MYNISISRSWDKKAVYVVSGKAKQAQLLEYCLSEHPSLTPGTYAYTTEELGNGHTQIRVVTTRV